MFVYRLQSYKKEEHERETRDARSHFFSQSDSVKAVTLSRAHRLLAKFNDDLMTCCF